VVETAEVDVIARCVSAAVAIAAISVAGGVSPRAVAGPRTLAAHDNAARAYVIDFSGACNTATGCLVSSPRTWLPDRTPRLGTGLVLRRIHWRFWGTGLANGAASVDGCVAGGASTVCWSGVATFRVYQPYPDRRTGANSKRIVYQCLLVNAIHTDHPQFTNDIAGVETDISGDVRTNCPRYLSKPKRGSSGVWTCSGGSGYGPAALRSARLTCGEAQSLTVWLLERVPAIPPNATQAQFLAIVTKSLARVHRGVRCKRTKARGSGSFHCVDAPDKAWFDWAYGG
jgi:hypothetical protein